MLVVLGAPNASSGKLSKISKSRLDCCANLYESGMYVLCTGGWGKHFNISKEPHAVYAKQYLLKKGISESDFLKFALSGNTVEDAVMIKPIISKLENPKLAIITSDYHLERVRLIFDEILIDHKLEYIGTPTMLSKTKLEKLINHEQSAISQIKENGLYYDHIK